MAADEFFSRVGREVFETYLKTLGAHYCDQSSTTVVRFAANDWYVDLILLPEDGPRYSPRVEIGPLPELGSLSRERQVDIMHTVPIGNELRNYNLQWRYRDAAEMLSVYERAREQIFKPFAVQYLIDPERLRELVTRRREEIEREWRADIANHNEAIYRNKADHALHQADYANFVMHMEKIPEERWSAADRKKIEIARRRNCTGG
jgi:hypothetical protein